MGKIIIHLKQHTPMLHFQHDQHGATLRATEVKPKLDKFILIKLGNDYEKGKATAKSKGWLIGDGSNPALDYKMRITPVGSKEKDISLISENESSKPKSPFFGNLGDNTNLKDLINYPDGLNLTIFTLNSEIQHFITKELICEYFAYTNFGTRQSKGFGSFYIDPEDNDYYLPITVFLGKSTILQSFFNSNKNTLFSDIDLFYKSIRSGIYPFKKGAYVASAMNTYLFAKRKEWDKTTIRKVIDGAVGANGAMLYRDLLGLASLCNYGHNGGTISKEIPDVERFKSPIFIKPISTNNSYVVYIGYFQLPNNENIIEKTVQITGENINIKGAINRHFKFNISTPSKNEFNLSDYMNFVFTKFDISKCINKKSLDSIKIEKIYQNLRTNYKNNK